MNKAKQLFFLNCAAICLLAGCAETQRYETIEQVCAANLEKSAVMRAAEEVLGEMHFVIDKADTELGLIKTRPLAGGRLFEFWRSDNVGAFNTAEANLHTVRRTVKLDISRQDGQLCIGCDVKVERLSLPERQITSSARAYGMFTASKASIQTLRLDPGQKRAMAWVDLGEDARLATEILKRIERKLDLAGEVVQRK